MARQSRNRKTERVDSNGASAESTNKAWNDLESHLASTPAFSALSESTRREVFAWFRSHSPFRDEDELLKRMGKSKIRGLSKLNQRSIVDSLTFKLTRRPFLAGLGVLSTGALGIGLAKSKEESHPTENGAAPYETQPLLAELNRRQSTVGEALDFAVTKNSTDETTRPRNSTEWRSFLHALDTSNWLEASLYFSATEISGPCGQALSSTPYYSLVRALKVLGQGWDYLTANHDQWQDEYFIAYAFGKMPALASGSPNQPPIPQNNEEIEKHVTAIHHVAPLFHALEMVNQLYQNPGSTVSGAPVRITQGHNFSFAHFSTDLQDEELFSPDQSVVLVNWDAHADLSEPFDNPRIPVQDGFGMLQRSKSFSERILAASFLSIAGWILPVVYQGWLTRPQRKTKLVWVVPKEAMETSKGYMEPYGAYSLSVGDWLLPDSIEEISQFSTRSVTDSNIPGSTEIRRFSEHSTLKSISSPDLLRNAQACELHIVNPDNTSEIDRLLENEQIALSIDADFAGTREPGTKPRRGYLPHYPLNGNEKDRKRHVELVQQLGEFCHKFGDQIRAVSIANSPNFSVDEELRKPVSRILRLITSKSKRKQPRWVDNEISRSSAPQLQSTDLSIGRALTIGGIGGLATMIGLLSQDWRKLRSIRSLLFQQNS